MQAQKIRFFQKGMQVHKIVKSWSRLALMVKHLHSESSGPLGHCLPYAAQAKDPQLLAADLPSQPVQWRPAPKFTPSHSLVTSTNASGDVQDQDPGQVCGGVSK